MPTISNRNRISEFFKGMESYLDLYGILADKRFKNICLNDKTALENDWSEVGNDIKYAISIHKKLLEK